MRVDHREPDTVGGLRNRELQGLAGLQRNLRHHVDGLAADRDLHLVVAENLQHPGAITVPGCRTTCRVHALRGMSGLDFGLMTIDMDDFTGSGAAEAIRLS